VLHGAKQDRESDRERHRRAPVADNDDELPAEILNIIDALARAAARRDHHAALRETADHD